MCSSDFSSAGAVFWGCVSSFDKYPCAFGRLDTFDNIHYNTSMFPRLHSHVHIEDNQSAIFCVLLINVAPLPAYFEERLRLSPSALVLGAYGIMSPTIHWARHSHMSGLGSSTTRCCSPTGQLLPWPSCERKSICFCFLSQVPKELQL